jgi:hypothetical protein
MENTVFYLIGPPGVGKYTVGKIIAARTGAKLVDNHYWNNVIFGLIQEDGFNQLPNSVWVQVGRVRAAVLDTIATLSPPSWSFVFTHAAEDGPGDREMFAAIRAAGEARRCAMIVALLSCGPDTLAARVVGADRRARMKETNPVAARINAVRPAFDPGYPRSMRIDTTHLAPEQVADQIIAAARSPPRAG